nr:MAG TPA: hypothetical protein [Caudoviricetes sp.]
MWQTVLYRADCPHRVRPTCHHGEKPIDFYP